MASIVVEGFYVVEEDGAQFCSSELAPGSPNVADFTFDGGPHRFHRGVVVGVADTAVGADDSPIRKLAGELERSVLAAVVGVMNQFCLRRG